MPEHPDGRTTLAKQVSRVALGPAVAERRLVAVLCMDMAGYTRLMRDDEAATLRVLRSHRTLAARLIDRYGGRIANTAGDSILASFASSTQALQCALDLQERIAAVNAEVREERRAWFRIGLNVGEVTIRDGDVFGDGVNVAARLQTLAQQGTICLSGVAYEVVRPSVPMEFEDLGVKAFKNVGTPIQAYLARPRNAGEHALPRPHRDQEIHLARRFFNLLFDAIRGVEREVGLEFMEAPVLASAEDKPGIGEREIAGWLGISAAKARAIVAKLVGHGLVERRNEGSRPAGLHLTELGSEVRARLRPLATAAQDAVMTPLSEAERDELRSLLGRVIKASDALREV